MNKSFISNDDWLEVFWMQCDIYFCLRVNETDTVFIDRNQQHFWIVWLSCLFHLEECRTECGPAVINVEWHWNIELTALYERCGNFNHWLTDKQFSKMSLLHHLNSCQRPVGKLLLLFASNHWSSGVWLNQMELNPSAFVCNLKRKDSFLNIFVFAIIIQCWIVCATYGIACNSCLLSPKRTR